MAQSRIKKLERMEFVDFIEEEGGVNLPFYDPEPLTPPILQFADVSFGYTKGQLLFRRVNLGIDMESRIALVGPNGVGKSTFMKLMAGELEPLEGNVIRSGKLKLGRFTQHFVDQLDLNVSPLEYMSKQFPSVPSQELRSVLGSFGLSGSTALRSMHTLSGGQKSRVALAQLSFSRPHILLLDEPTNHLDLETIEALAVTLSTFAGGVLLISHDERLISLTCDKLWYFHN